MDNKLIINTKEENLEDKYSELKFDLSLYQEIEKSLENKAENGIDLSSEENAQLVDISKKMLSIEYELKLIDYQDGTAESFVKQNKKHIKEISALNDEFENRLNDSRKTTDIYDRGQQTFNSVSDRETLKQVTTKSITAAKTSFRRTRKQIENFYKAQINLKRPNLKQIYLVAELLRVLGIENPHETMGRFERKLLKNILFQAKK